MERSRKLLKYWCKAEQDKEYYGVNLQAVFKIQGSWILLLKFSPTTMFFSSQYIKYKKRVGGKKLNCFPDCLY
jgi:hypothetical protein